MHADGVYLSKKEKPNMKTNLRSRQAELLAELNAMPAHKVGSQWEADRLGELERVTAENAKREGSRRALSLRKRQVAPFVWEVQPREGALAIFESLSGFELFDRSTGAFRLNTGLRGDEPSRIESRLARIAAYNAGKRWA